MTRRLLLPPLDQPLLLVGRLTLLVLLLAAGGEPARLVFVALVAVAVWPRDHLLLDGRVWSALGLVLAMWNLLTWQRLDNHVVLAGYWTLALGLSLLARDPLNTLRRNARLLVGLAFAFAVFWKVVSPDFSSGEFFRFALLTDPRFTPAAELLGGLSAEDAAVNRDALVRLAGPGSTDTVSLISGPRIAALAAAMTQVTLVLEALVAAAFLFPEGPNIHLVRHGALVMFSASTYALVPVAGFGAVLLVMGTADARSSVGRRAYSLGLVALVLYTLVWTFVVLG